MTQELDTEFFLLMVNGINKAMENGKTYEQAKKDIYDKLPKNKKQPFEACLANFELEIV